MKKATFLEEQNLLMLITIPNDPAARPKVGEYLTL